MNLTASKWVTAGDALGVPPSEAEVIRSWAVREARRLCYGRLTADQAIAAYLNTYGHRATWLAACREVAGQRAATTSLGDAEDSCA